MSKKNTDFFDKKKSWSLTKDSILGTYLVPYFAKLLAYGKPICYIDCFSGKGMFGDGKPGSPLIAIENINNSLSSTKSRNPRINGFFIELNYSKELKENIINSKPIFPVEVIDGKFEDKIDNIIFSHSDDTIFMYVDPYGIKALNVDKFNSFSGRQTQSVEMLINFNTWGFFREACRVLGAKFVLDEETSEYLVEYETYDDVDLEELNTIAGSNFWIDVVNRYKSGKLTAKQAEYEIASGIAENFKKSYKYVLNVPVKSSIDNKTPKYRLFYLTKHENGCIVMANIMYRRLNEAIEREKEGQMSLFSLTTEGEVTSDSQIKKRLLEIVGYGASHISEVLCKYFTSFGIDCSVPTINSLLKELEVEESVTIKRTPQYNKNGKPTTFMTESKGQAVLVSLKKNESDVQYILRKSLLYKTDVEYGDYTINHILGCSHGCLFPCYAFNMAKRFGNVKTYKEWLEPKLVKNALELLDIEIPKYKNDIKSVQLCFTTDPFMLGHEEISDMSIKIIKRLNKDGIKVSVLTKGVLPTMLAETEKYNEYGITLVSLNEAFRKKYEPYCSKYVDRISSLKKLHDEGFKTWVSIEPYPTPNIIEQNLDDILNAISFVDYIVFGRWHYNKLISEYKDFKNYYIDCANKVIDFCKKHNIRYHIKKGTITPLT